MHRASSSEIVLWSHFLHYRPECEAQVKGFAGPVFKKFKTSDEAEEFVRNRGNSALLFVSETNRVDQNTIFNENFNFRIADKFGTIDDSNKTIIQ